MGASKELFMQVREEETALQNGVSFEHLIDAKKSNIAHAVSLIEQSVKDGNYDQLKALVLAKKGSEFFTQLEKAVRPLAEDAYVYKVGKDYSAFDTKIEASETGVKYDYSVCGDSIWDDLNHQENKAKELKSEREKLLKTITKPTTFVDDLTGDIYTVNPPVRSAKLGLKLTIK